jgi:hypothetical protein
LIPFDSENLSNNWDRLFATSEKGKITIQDGIYDQISANTTSRSIVYNSGEGEIIVTVPKLSEDGEPYFIEFHVYGNIEVNKQLIPEPRREFYKFVFDPAKVTIFRITYTKAATTLTETQFPFPSTSISIPWK